MGFRWKRASGLAQVATVLAVVGTVSLGLCGITWIFPRRGDEFGGALGGFGFLGLVISFLGLAGVGVVWIVKSLIDKISGRDKPVRLFENQDESGLPESPERGEDKK